MGEQQGCITAAGTNLNPRLAPAELCLCRWEASRATRSMSPARGIAENKENRIPIVQPKSCLLQFCQTISGMGGNAPPHSAADVCRSARCWHQPPCPASAVCAHHPNIWSGCSASLPAPAHILQGHPVLHGSPSPARAFLCWRKAPRQLLKRSGEGRKGSVGGFAVVSTAWPQPSQEVATCV